MRLRLIIGILSFLGLAGITRADLENFYVDKRAVYYQLPNTNVAVPKNGAYLDYYFDLEQNTNLYSASFTANLGQVPIQFQDDEQWRGYVAFPSLNALKNTYSNLVFYEFKTQLFAQGQQSSSGKYSSSDRFPLNVPQASNSSAISSINPFFNFTLNLSFFANGAAGSGFVNYIQLTLLDPVTLEQVYQNQYAWSDLSLDIPGNTMDSNSSYLARIQFISPDTLNPASGTNKYPVLSRYLRETWLPFKTTGSTTTLVPLVSRNYHWSQQSAGTPAADTDLDSLTVKIPRPAIDDLAAATLTQVGVQESYALSEDVDNPDYAFTTELTGEELEGFISGLLAVGWRHDSGATNMAMDHWELTDPTDGPRITNWTECQAIPPIADFTVMAQKADNAPDELSATLEIRDSTDSIIAKIEATVEATDGIVEILIPASTLPGSQTYQVSLSLANISAAPNGLDLQTDHIISFPIATSAANWPGVKTAGLYRGYHFDNETGEADSALKAWFSAMITEDNPGELSSASIERILTTQIIPKATGEYTLQRSDSISDQLRMVQSFTSEATMLNSFPNAQYRLRTFIDDAESQAIMNLQDVNGTPLDLQVDTSYLNLNLDPSLPIPVRWTGFDASIDGQSVVIQVTAQTPSSPENPVDYIPVADISNDGLSGSIAANTLPPHTDFEINVIFRRDLEIDTSSVPDATLFLGDEHWTNTILNTGAAGYLDWLTEYMDSTQLADPAFSAPDANPDGDPLTNLQEFALNLHPLQSSQPPELKDASVLYLFEFDWRSDNPLLTYEVLQTTTLVPPFSPYEGTPNVLYGDPYSTVRISFPLVPQMFVQLITRLGAAD